MQNHEDAVAEVVANIKLNLPTFGGIDGFLSDPGGWIDYAALTEDDEVAAAAIERVRVECKPLPSRVWAGDPWDVPSVLDQPAPF